MTFELRLTSAKKSWIFVFSATKLGWNNTSKPRDCSAATLSISSSKDLSSEKKKACLMHFATVCFLATISRAIVGLLFAVSRPRCAKKRKIEVELSTKQSTWVPLGQTVKDLAVARRVGARPLGRIGGRLLSGIRNRLLSFL